MRRGTRYTVYGLAAGATCAALVLAATPSFALGADVIQDSLDSMKTTQTWWDSLWATTFGATQGTAGTGTTSLSDYMFSNVVHWFLSLSLLFWIVKMLLNTGQMINLNLTGMIQSVIPFLFSFAITLLLLANNAEVARLIPWAMRDNINAWRNGLMSAQVTDLTVRGSLTDVFMTKQGQDKVTAEALKCSQMPHPQAVLPSPTRPEDTSTLNTDQRQAYDFIDCMNTLQQTAQKTLNDAQAATCTDIPGVNQLCGLAVRVAQKTYNTFVSVTSTETKRLQQGDLGALWDFTPIGYQQILDNYLGGVAASMGFKALLNAIQWCFISMMELGLWVDGLIAPIAVATALVPGQLNLTIAWAISFLSIGLSQIAYTAVIGATAVLLSQSTTYSASDIRFELALGVFAPLVCTAVLTGGGIAAARAYTGQAVGISMAAISITTGISSSIMGAAARFADARR